MDVGTLIRFLFGDREAILRLAASRWTLVIGLLFVLSAGLAREYDGEDLLHEPWHLLLPLGASLPASFVLFNLAFLRPWRSGPRIGYWSAYLSFLGLFWMTAPLAWLYAIPYEHWFDEIGSMRANFRTLGLVALWRVALMSRVLIVLLDYPWRWAIQIVVFSSALVAGVALASLGPPVILGMAGIRESPVEAALNAAKLQGWMGLICSAPFWCAGGIEAIVCTHPRWMPTRLNPFGPYPTWGVWITASVSLLVWVIVLPGPQCQQQHRYAAESAFGAGRIDEALAKMSALQRTDFPARWNPPPTPMLTGDDLEPQIQWYGKLLLASWQKIQKTPPAPWVRAAYVDKLRGLLLDGLVRWLEQETALGLCGVLDSLPETPELFKECRDRYHLPSRLKEVFLEYCERRGRSGEQALRRWRELGGD
jgi:hypothetical protein